MGRSTLRTVLTIGIALEVVLIAVAAVALARHVSSEEEGTLASGDLSLFPQAVTPPATTTPRPSIDYLPAPAWTPSATPAPSAVPAPTAPLPTAVATPTPLAGIVPIPPWLLPAYPLPEAADVPVLYYHYVEELPADADPVREGLTVTPAEFSAQLQYLADHGFTTITAEQLFLHLVQAEPLPANPVMLTFDDGYRDAYEVVLPLLQQHGFVGTFFIFTDAVDQGSPAYLTWPMVQEMSWAGMDLQSHGRRHIATAGLSEDLLLDEVQGSKATIESHLGRPVRFFCYPYGAYDDTAVAALGSSGYLGAFTTAYGQWHTRDNLYRLQRIRMGPGVGPEELSQLLGEGW